MSLDPIQPHATLDQLHAAAADAFCDLATRCVQSQGTFRVSLSGGSTPRRLYELLAERSLPWDKIHWYWGDERNVPHDHAESNYQMVREALLDPIAADPATVHPVPVAPDDPVQTALAYEQTLREDFATDVMPGWDLVLLGMGDDAHTASLFPGTSAIDQTGRWFVENWVEKFNAFRYTLTAPAINSARESWFLVAGSAKRAALQQVLGQTRDVHQYPAQLIHPTRWFVTADAYGE